MKISLCITTYNRYELTLKSFEKVLNDERITEIIIVDDCSTDGSYRKLQEAVKDFSKVRLYQNDFNVGMSLNKAKAIGLAENDWAIIFDSDNSMDSSFIDAIYSHMWDEKTIFCPSFSKPHFDFRAFSGKTYSRKNIKELINNSQGEVAANTCNYFVNRNEYLKVYEHNKLMKGTDTIWFNYKWLESGNQLYITPGMEYEHRVWAGSGFMQHCNYNMAQAKKLKHLILAL